MKFYFTESADGDAIERDAHIVVVEAATLDLAARSFLRPIEEGFVGEFHELSYEPGEFGDCWKKFPAAPTSDDVTPFALAEVSVAEPGSHPGNNEYWVTPLMSVYVPK